MILALSDIELLLKYSNLDIFYENQGGIDASFYTCPSCGCSICCDDYDDLDDNYRNLLEHDESCELPKLLELKKRMEDAKKEILSW